MALLTLVAVAETAATATSHDDSTLANIQLSATGGAASVVAAALYAAKRHAAAASATEAESWSNVYASLLLLCEAIAIVQALELLNGFSRPDTGEDLNDFSVKFENDIQNILRGAAPTNWSSPSADTYKHHNSEQQCRMRVIARADRWAAMALNDQAHVVAQLREVFADCRLGLVGATGVLTAGAVLWKRYWTTGNLALADAIAMTMAHFTCAVTCGAIAELIFQIGFLIDTSRKTGKYLRDNVTTLYQLLVDDVHQWYPSRAASIVAGEPMQSTSAVNLPPIADQVSDAPTPTATRSAPT